MSKASIGMFSGTLGARRARDVRTHKRIKTNTIAVYVDPKTIRFSQDSVSGSSEIIESMMNDGWKGDPIDVVVMKDGELTTLDNTRVIAAQLAGINVMAVIHEFDDPLPDQSTRERFATPKGGEPGTWGQAVENRIGKQSSEFRRDDPNGSYNLRKIK